MLKAAALSLLVLANLSALAAGGGDAARLNILVSGTQKHIDLVSGWLKVDPVTIYSVIPSRAKDTGWSTREIQRFVRIYFPRSYEELIEYDYMMLLDIEIYSFSNKQQRMLHDSIHDDGLGGLQTRSVMSMHTGISIPWADSVLSDAFPNDADAVVAIDYRLHGLPMRVVINSNPNVPDVLRPYKELPGCECSFGIYGTNLAIPKAGTVVTSYSVGPYDYGYPGIYPDPGFEEKGWIPHSMYWEYGNGTTWTHQDMIVQHNYWSTAFNPYAPDMVVAEILFSTGRKLPQDVVQAHRLRVKFMDYDSAKGLLFSVLDFVDRFGANSDPILNSMAEISVEVGKAEDRYLEGYYLESWEIMNRALSDIQGLNERSLELKDRALLWVYVTEWLAVSGVFLLASYSIWTLMIRRRIYREVETTRLVG